MEMILTGGSTYFLANAGRLCRLSPNNYTPVNPAPANITVKSLGSCDCLVLATRSYIVLDIVSAEDSLSSGQAFSAAPECHKSTERKPSAIMR